MTTFPIRRSNLQFRLQAGDIVLLKNGGSTIVDSVDRHPLKVDGYIAFGRIGSRGLEWNALTGEASIFPEIWSVVSIRGGAMRWFE